MFLFLLLLFAVTAAAVSSINNGLVEADKKLWLLWLEEEGRTTNAVANANTDTDDDDDASIEMMADAPTMDAAKTPLVSVPRIFKQYYLVSQLRGELYR